jgi:hypothetical protein
MSVWLPDADDHMHIVDDTTDSMRLTVVLPSPYMFLPDQHHHLHITSSDEMVVSVPPFGIPDLTFDWDLPIEVHGEGEAELHLEGQVFFCPVTDATICIYATIDQRYHVRVEGGSGLRLEIVHDIQVLDAVETARTARYATVEAADEK